MKVEILRPPTTSFVVGRDLVGYGKVGNDPDVWEDLIPNAGAFSPQRGGTTTPKVNALDVGTLSVPLKDMDPETDDRLRVGRRLRLVDEQRGDRVLWFGRLSDIPATDAQTHMVTTLAATDAVDELGNANAKGVGVPGEVETLRSRVERLGAVSTVPLVYRQDVTDLGTLTAAWGPEARKTAVLKSGHKYQIKFDWTIGEMTGPGAVPGFADLDFEGGGLLFPLGEDGAKAGTVTSRVFTPNAPGEMVLGLHANANGPITAKNIRLTRIEGPAVLQAVGREAPLTEHLDMACDSVGAVWRPMLDGTVEVLEGDLVANVLGRLTDDPDDVGAVASYTKLDLGFAATDDLINELTVTNHGPAAETTRVYTNAASIAAHGRRSASIDLCLSTGELLDVRAGELLAQAATPRWSPRSLTYVYESLPFVPDLYDVLDVRRRGVTHRCLVLGISHELEPDRSRPNGVKHLVTLTLRKVA